MVIVSLFQMSKCESEVDRKWTGNGPEMDQKWTGSRPEEDRKLYSSGPNILTSIKNAFKIRYSLFGEVAIVLARCLAKV